MFHVKSFPKYANRVLLNSVLLALLSNSFSFAASVSNFGQWRGINPILKTVYISGVLDTFIRPLEEPRDHEEFVMRFNSCLKDFNITVVEIVQMVDNFYLNTQNWGSSPQEAIRFQLINGHCFHYLN